MSTSFIKPKKIKRYKTLDKLMAFFFGCKESQVSEFSLGGTNEESNKNYVLTYKKFKENAEIQGIWGFIKEDKVMHVWFKENIPIEDLVIFIAHEAGHLNGRQYKDIMKEEKKAKLFEEVAIYAYKNALKILV
jgi:uncharacterized protein YjaZ